MVPGKEFAEQGAQQVSVEARVAPPCPAPGTPLAPPPERSSVPPLPVRPSPRPPAVPLPPPPPLFLPSPSLPRGFLLLQRTPSYALIPFASSLWVTRRRVYPGVEHPQVPSNPALSDAGAVPIATANRKCGCSAGSGSLMGKFSGGTEQ